LSRSLFEISGIFHLAIIGALFSGVVSVSFCGGVDTVYSLLHLVLWCFGALH